jgi:hypothetical protein
MWATKIARAGYRRAELPKSILRRARDCYKIGGRPLGEAEQAPGCVPPVDESSRLRCRSQISNVGAFLMTLRAGSRNLRHLAIAKGVSPNLAGKIACENGRA